MTYGLSDKFSNEQSDIEPNRKHLKGNYVRRCIGFWVYMGNGHCITVITDFLTISRVDRLHPEAPTRRICAAKTVWLFLHAGPGPKVGQASVQHQHWESGIIVTKWKILGCPPWRNQYGTRIVEENGSKRPIISGFDKERELWMLLYNRWLVGRRSSGMMEHFVTQFPDYILSHNLLLYYFESYSYPLVCYLEKNGWNNIWQDRCWGSGAPHCV